MLPRLRAHLGGHAVAYVALFFALGGGISWAAQKLPAGPSAVAAPS